MLGERVAVIDIGSNSGRVVVLEIGERGTLEVIDELRAPLRLARALDHDGRLTHQGFETTIEAVAEFVALGRGQGAGEIRAVGTFAMREAKNGRVLAELIRERFGVPVEILDGHREAQFGFAGAVYGVDVTDGLSLDIGGGSLQLVRFHDRTPVHAWTFPFGALRLTDNFLPHDPPKPSEVRALRDHIRAALRDAGVPSLGAGEALVGTGGTIRNLAKIDLRRRRYPLARLHAYRASHAGIRRVVRTLVRLDASARAGIPGLNSTRADSIAAGAVAVDEVMAFVGATEVHVSGQGLREGVIRGALLETLPSPAAVRAASVRSLCSEFRRWSQPHADRRSQLAVALFDAVIPDADAELRECLYHAAQVIDIGATIDVYNRHSRAADVVLDSDLQGFSHRQLVTVASLLMLAERPGVSLKALRPLVDELPGQALAAAATLLDLADQTERRSPPDVFCDVRVDMGDGIAVVRAPVSQWWRATECQQRFRDSFGIELEVVSELG